MTSQRASAGSCSHRASTAILQRARATSSRRDCAPGARDRAQPNAAWIVRAELRAPPGVDDGVDEATTPVGARASERNSPTRDFDTSSAFYGDVLGLERSSQWGTMPAAELETGSLTIAIVKSDAFGIDFSGPPTRSHCTSTTSPRRARNSSPTA
jgi:hypothetical protein